MHPRILIELCRLVVRPGVLLSVCGVLLVLVSSVGVVFVAHNNRQLYARLEEIRESRDTLESDYEKLLLERSAWTDLSRIEDLSSRRLAMREPLSGEFVVVAAP